MKKYEKPRFETVKFSGEEIMNVSNLNATLNYEILDVYDDGWYTLTS